MKKILLTIIAIVFFNSSFFFVHKSSADEFDDFLTEIQSDSYQAYLSIYLDSNNKLFWKSDITVGGLGGTFYGLTGTDFAVLSGSGIYSGLLFNDNSAVFSGNIVFENFRASLYGGAIHSADSSLNFSNTKIHFSSNSAINNNGAWGLGGAFYAVSNITIAPKLIDFSNAQVYFSSNNAGSGGAIYASFSTFAFTGAQVHFSSNSAFSSNAGGGAILAENNALVNFYGAYLVYFTSNYAAHDGGAIHLNNSKIDFSGAYAEFVGNRAAGSGGAIYAIASTIVFSASEPIVFLDNKSLSQEGNDIFLDGSFLTLQTIGAPIKIYGGIKALRGSQFSFSSQGGGFLYLSGINVFDAMNAFDLSAASKIEIASAVFSYQASRHIELINHALISFYASTASFRNNSGGSGGALFLSSSTIKFIKSSAAFNTNSAVSSGGAVFVYKSTVEFQNSSIYAFGNNAQNGSGGAFYLEDSNAGFLNSYADFYENRGRDGLNDFHLSNSTFTLISSRLSLKSGIQSFLSSEINADNSRLLLGGINTIRGAGHFNLSHSSLTVLDASFLYEQNDFAFNLSFSSAHFGLSIASFGANGQEGAIFLRASVFSVHLSSLAFLGGADFIDKSALKLMGSFLLFSENVFFEDAVVFEILHSTVLIKNSSFTFIRAQKTALNLENSRLSFVSSTISFADNFRLSIRGGGVLDAKNSLISWTSSTVHFINNKAELLTAQGGHGGIFYLEKSEVNFISAAVHITSASASGRGGAFYLERSTINFVQAAVFASSNIAISSGGIFYIAAGKASFKDSSINFSFNEAGIDGGAFYVGNGELSLVNVDISFIGNSAGGRGGALFLNNSIVSFSAGADIVFSENEAGGYSNDIFMTSSKLTLTANQFQIRLEGGIDAKISTIIYSNAADGNLFLSGTNKFENMSLFDIAAFSSITVLNAEIKFLNSSLANISLNNSQISFLSSSASFKAVKTKGALILDRSKAVFEDALLDFSSNSANSGGAFNAINFSSAGFSNSNALFSSNVSLGLSVSDGGGAIFSASKSSVNFTNSWIFFKDNDAKTRGGALFADDNSAVHFLKSTSVFAANKATQGGALMMRAASTVSFAASSAAFINNSASGIGGAVLSSGNFSSLNFLNSDVFFDGNKKTGAGLGGGALAAINGSIISFVDSSLEFKNNQSGGFGGAVFASAGATIKFENVEMKAQNNTSISSGGAFYIASNSSVSFIAQDSDILFSANKAFGKPNDVYIDNAKLYLISYGRQIRMEGGIISTNSAQTIYKSAGGSLYLGGINDFNNSTLEFAQESSITVANASFTYRNSTLPLLLIKSTINFLSSRVSFHDNGRNISLSSSRFSAQHSILNFQNGLDASKSSITISGGYLASNGQSHFETMSGFDLHNSSAAIENAIWKYIDSQPMTLRASTMVFEGALTSLTFSHSNARNNDLVFSANAQMIFNARANQEVWIANGIRTIGEGSITKTGLGIVVFIGSNTRMMNSAFVLKQGTAVFMSAKTTMTALSMSTRTALEMRSGNFLSGGASLRNETAIRSPFISSGIFFGFDIHFSTDKPSWADFLSVQGALTFAWTSTVTARLDAFNDDMRVMGTSVAFMGAASDPDISNLWLILENGAAGDENKFSMIAGSKRIWLVYVGGWNAFVRAYKLAGNGGNVSLLKDIKAGDDESPPLPFLPNMNERNVSVFGNNFTVDSDGVSGLGFDFRASSATFRDISFTSFTRSSGAVMIVNTSTIIFIRQISFFNNSAVSSGGAVFAGGRANIRFMNAVSFFDSNHAGGGGVFYAQGASIIFSSGAVYFTSNSAILGGAIFADKNSDVRFSSGIVYFTSNSAQFGGAVFAREASINFASGTIRFSSNNANFGGALYLLGSEARFINGRPNFIGNVASSSGGAISAQNSSLFIENPVFSENLASGRPNDIFISNSRLEISAKEQQARFEGGIIAIAASDIFFTHRNGGRLYLSGTNKFEGIRVFSIADRSEITIENASFEYKDNVSSFSLSANSQLTFKDSTGSFSNNSNGKADIVLMSRAKASFEFSKVEADNISAQNLSILFFERSSLDIFRGLEAQNASATFNNSQLYLAGNIKLQTMRNFDLNISSALIEDADFLFERNFILRRSVLTFRNSDIFFNSANIYVEHSTINVLGSGDRRSIVFGGSGGIYLRSSLLLLDMDEGASINGIDAQGSIVDINGLLELSGRNFFDASSLILRQGSILNIAQSSFSYRNNDVLLLDNVSFNFRGRFALWRDNLSGALKISNSDIEFKDADVYFINNRAENGGAIFDETAIEAARFVNSRTLFADNIALSSGGAIYQEQETIVSFSGGAVDFTRNSAFLGGAVFAPRQARLDFENIDIRFLNNSAESGGAVYLSNSSMTFMGGGAIFSGNIAASSGGAIFATEQSYVFMLGGQGGFFGNRSLAGGAIYVDNSQITISNADFIGNRGEGGIRNDIYLKDGSELMLIVSDGRQAVMEGGIIDEGGNIVLKRGQGILKFSTSAIVNISAQSILSIEEGAVKFEANSSSIGWVNIFEGAAIGIRTDFRRASSLYFSTISIAENARLLVDTIRPVPSTGMTIDFLNVNHKEADDFFENKNIFAGEYQYSFYWRKDDPNGDWIGYLKYLGKPVWETSYTVSAINGSFYAGLMSLAARTNFNFDVLDKTQRIDSLWIIGGSAVETLGTESENPFETQNSGIKVGIDLISDGGIFMGYGKIQAQNGIGTADGSDMEIGFYKVWRGQDIKVNAMIGGALTEINTDDSFHIKSQAARAVLEIEKAAWSFESWRLSPFIGIHGGYAMIDKTSIKTRSWRHPGNPQELLMDEFPSDKQDMAVLELPPFNWMRLKTLGGLKFEFRTFELLRISLKAYGGTIALGNKPKFKTPQIEIEGMSEGDFFAGAGLAFEYRMTPKASLIMGGNFEMSDTGRAFSANFGASFKIGALRGDTWGQEEKPIVKEKPKKKPKKPKKESSKDDESKKQEQEKTDETKTAQMQTIERAGGIRTSSQTRTIERTGGIVPSSQTRTGKIEADAQVRRAVNVGADGKAPAIQVGRAAGTNQRQNLTASSQEDAQPQIRIVINEAGSGGRGIVQNNRRIFRIYAADFISSSGNLTPKGKADIRRIVSLIVRDGYSKIAVEGHTDAAGDDGINLALQKNRTQTVISELKALGIPEGDMEYLWIGSRVPIASDKTPIGRNMNRRVEIRVE